MKRNARLFVVMLGLGVAGGAWAAKPQGAVGPDISNAVQTQKAVGPIIKNRAVKTEKAVGPSGSLAVKTDKAVGPVWARAVHTDKAVGQDEKSAAQRPVLDLNAGF